MCDEDFDGFAPLSKKKKIPSISKAAKDNLRAGPSDKRKATGRRSKPEKLLNRKSREQASCSYSLEATDQRRGFQNVSAERCPVCQMPLSLLRIESPEWHVTECLSSPFTSTKECPAGTKCDSTIASHYKKFKHTELSELSDTQTGNNTTEGNNSSSRNDVVKPIAKAKLDNDRPESPKNAAKENSCDTSVNQPDKLQNLVADSDSDDDIFSQDVTESVSQTGGNFVESIVFNDAPDSIKQAHDGDLNIEDCDGDLNKHQSGTFECEKEDMEDGLEDELSEAEGSDGCDDEENEEDELLENGTESATEESGTLSAAENAIDEFDVESTDIPDSSLLSCDDVGSSQGSQNSSYFRNLQSSQEKSGTGDAKANLNRTQSSILSFFVPPNNGLKQKSLSNGTGQSTDKSSKSYTPPPRSNLIDKAAAKTFMNQFNRTGQVSSAPMNAVSRNTEKKSNGSDTNEAANNGGTGYKRSCPFYKKIPGTSFTVDAFSYGAIPGCSAYFLSHFHYDHYRGLDKRFTGPIYCSKVTANLVKKKLSVNPRLIRILDMNSPTRVEGVNVTLLDANHCPGSVLFLFSLPDGSSILHTGDFRADPCMELYPELQNVSIKQLYLDTTYCDAAYSFPPQKDVIMATIDVTRNHLHHNPNTLIAVGAYTIGKERIFLAIAEEFNCQVCVAREKQRILECLENPVINKRITTIAQGARLHVLPMKQLNFRDLSAYLEKFNGCYDNILAFEPTGWTHSRGASSDILKLQPKLNRSNITIYGVPYSEHSSFSEMKRFVQWCRPQKIIPTVNVGSPSSRAKMEAHFKAWMSERKTPTAKQLNIGNFFAAPY